MVVQRTSSFQLIMWMGQQGPIQLLLMHLVLALAMEKLLLQELAERHLTHTNGFLEDSQQAMFLGCAKEPTMFKFRTL